MSITDELREYTKHYSVAGSKKDTMLTAIADRIDAEHEKQMAERRRNCVFYDAERNYCKVHDEGDMADFGWVRLPVDEEAPSKQLADWIERRGLVTGPLDANGELWHSGDMSDSNWGVIEGIAFEDGSWFISGHDTSAPWVPADSIRHYHAPTVEDLLLDACKAYHSLMVESMSDVAHDMPAPSEVIAKYAKLLTLAEEEDA